MNNIATNPAVINVTIEGIEADMAAAIEMNDSQRRFLDYMLGKTSKEPHVPHEDKLAVANCLVDEVIDGFPIAHSFDQVRFPALYIARGVRSRQAGVSNPTTSRTGGANWAPRPKNRSRRRATRGQMSRS